MSEILRIPKTFKKGGSFYLPVTVFDNNGAVVNIPGWVITAQLRNTSGVLLQTFTVLKILGGMGGQFAVTASAAQTALWPVGNHLMDILCDDGAGNVGPSDTMELVVEERITQ